MAKVVNKSNYAFKRLSQAEGIVSVSGMGLMIGIETKKDVKEVLSYCMEHGVLALTAKTKLRLLPALNIKDEDLEKAIDVIIEACKE